MNTNPGVAPDKMNFKGGCLDFSHLTELENIDLYIIEIYMKKQYKSSIIKNHKTTEKKKKVFPKKTT